MKKIRTKNFITCALITVFVLSLFAIGFATFIQKETRVYEEFKKQELDIFSKYTFERSMEIDGEKVSFKESGDEKFRYYHDENGNVLIREDDSLTYATLNDDGKVVSTGVSVTSTETKTETITVGDINLSLNPGFLGKEDRASTNGGLVTTYGDNNEEITEEVSQQPLLAGSTGKRTIVNFVILIKFNDTTDTVVNNAISSFDTYFNGVNNSLRNYYEVMSYHGVTINSILPRESGAVYVHNGGNRQDYNIKDSNTTLRRQKESELLTNAINATKDKFDLAGKNVDINGDGYVDSVSFLICGSNEATWGGLLWPHSWNLDAIDGSGFSTLGGAKVGDYSFNFSTSINTGILCHEMGHVLGAPDLYHYNYDYVPVGRWDLMAQNTNTPQYMLTYMREKYVGGIPSTQIVDVVDSGVYSLKPVALTAKTEVLSYRIRLNDRPNEYFMVEYRNPTIATSYDAAAPSTGLIVYRVREPHDFSSSIGNRDARFQSSLYPDEVHVFRPKVDMVSTTHDVYNNSAKDVNRANLSPQNTRFSAVGSKTSTAKYDYTNIFYSDGVNSKIEIEALSVGSESAMFRISLPTGTLTIPDNAFDGKITAEDVTLYNGSDWSGVQAKIRFGEINLQYLANVKLELLNTSGNVINTSNLNLGEFKDSYSSGQRVFEAPFVVNSKGNMQPSVFYTEPFEDLTSQPRHLRVSVINAAGKSKVLYNDQNQNYQVIGNDALWQQVVNAGDIQAKVFAGPRISLGINNEGTVIVSGGITTGVWEAGGKTNILGIAVGRKHLLALKKDMTVVGFGDNFYGETVVDSWYNIKQVAAGNYTSYGLANDGTVLSMGLNDHYQLNVGSWKNIVSIAAGAKHVIGLDNTGKVFATGDLQTQTGILQETAVEKITAGDSFSAVLRTDGTVGIYGDFNVGAGIPLQEALTALTGAVNIVAGSRHLLALMPNGTVKAIGDTSSNQCEVSGLYDIIDMAASEHHNVFLREDGVVEFTGIGVSQFGTNNPMVNLIYPVGTYIHASTVSTPVLVPDSGNRIKVGTSGIVSVDIGPTSTTYPRVMYTSSNEEVIKVEMLGEGTSHKTAKLIALSAGQAEITARVNGTSISKSVVMIAYEEKPLTGIAISQETIKMEVSKSVQLSYNFVPFDATNVGTITPTFTSSDPDVASVDSVTGRVTAQAVGETIITVSITIDAVEYTDTCTVTVVSDGISIEILSRSDGTIRVKQYSEIDPASIVMKVKIGVEDQGEIPVTPDMINCDTSTPGVKNLVVTYQGVTAYIANIVDVSRYVTFVEFTEIPKANYLLGDILSVQAGERGKIKITYSDNTSSNHDVNINHFHGYNSEKLGRQTLTYKVQDPVFTSDVYELKHNITVSDWVQSISFSPRILAYPFGEEMSVTEQVVLNMRSGNERIEDFDSPNLVIEGYSKSVEGYQDVVVKYSDTATGTTHSTAPVEIEVLLEGEITYKYKDQSGYIHYFEVTKGFSLDLEFVQNQGKIFKIGAKETTPDIWVRIENFDNNLVYDANNPDTEQKPELVICIQRYEDGVLVPEYVLARIQINLRGLSQSTSWGISKKDPNNPNNYILLTEETITTFKYVTVAGDPKPEDLRVRRALLAGGIDVRTPMELVYDPELINVVQTLGMRYLNEWKYTKIKILDTPEYIYPIENQTISYNGSIDIDVFVHMTLRGKILIDPTMYSIKYEKNGVFLAREKEGVIIAGEGYNTTLGEITATVEYSEEGYVCTKVFTVTVLDVFKSIRMVKEPKIDYWYGENFNPQTAKFEIEYESGEVREEYYDSGSDSYDVYPEMNSENVDDNGQALEIRYLINREVIQRWPITCYVKNYPSILGVNLKKFTYLYNEPLSIQEVRIAYANGENNRLGEARYTHNYNKQAIGIQAVTFTYKEEITLNGDGEAGSILLENPHQPVTITVSPENPKVVTLTVKKVINIEVIDKEDSITIVGSPNQREYQYGQALNILGLKLEVEYRSGGKLTLEGAAIEAANLRINYNPTQVGSQTVTITGQNIESAVATFGVYVGKDGESVLSYGTKEGIIVDRQQRIVAVKDEGVVTSEAFSLFANANYLTKHMVDKNGSSVDTGANARALRTGDRVIFKNADDFVVYDFVVNVFGDANGDGISTAADLEYMAQIILMGENKKYIMDLNGDGKVTQVDLVLFARKFALSV